MAHASEVNELNHFRKKAGKLTFILYSTDQLAIEAGAERLRELNGVRSQIDFKLFIMKLLKEEHRTIAAKILHMEN